ncbi:MAG: HAMP domain-containing sensor histidine kinase [Acutalibacteraceae bacterium]|nr:HAMP domain-containing sensor histidine kinase [Acutalibacteraceae bacterium]
MRTSVKFCLVLMMMCLSFVLLSVAVVENGLSAVKQADYEAVASVIAAVQEKYPEVSEQDIIAILNHATTSSQKKAADDMLKKYGITPEQTVVQSNREANVRMTLMIAGVGLLFSVSVLVFFWLFVRYKVRQECRLTRYLSRINAGSFELPKEKLTEDKSSVLSDEIYKTTLMLREKSEQSHRDKIALKDSLTDISHQLKTPLTSMLIMLDNIIEDDLPEELRNEFLNDIRESVHHISFLTYSLLKLSKLDANSIEFDIQPVSMKELFMTAIGRTSAIAAERGVALVQECEDITIRCDKRWLSEALTNIVKNCVEHTARDGRVRLSAEDTPLYTRMVVEDNGSGIDKDDLPHIFERFYKGKNADENSVGIGLSMSKSIIEKCGGYIKVVSAPDKGTTFIIKFFKL